MIDGTKAWREQSARRLLVRLRHRTALHEGIGILGSWRTCDQQEARDCLLAEHGDAGQDAEASRMIAAVDAAAIHRSDPDAQWE